MKSIEELTKAQNDLIDEIHAFAESNNFVSEKVYPIYDGVADIEAYLKSSLKIMWILKEGYDDFDEKGNPIGGGWYMWDLWDKPDAWKQRTQVGMSYVLYGFRNNLTWGELPAISRCRTMVNELKSIAYININKMPGQRKTSPGRAQEKYNFWKNIINKQIDTYDPEVIIFGGTMRFFDIDKEKISHITTIGSDKLYIEIYKFNNRWLISTVHPQLYSELFVDGLIDALKLATNK